MKRLLLLVGLVLAAAGCGGGGTTTATVVSVKTVTETVTTQAAPPAAAPCSADSLRGAFATVPGSAGAGQISYLLRLQNDGSATCFVSGLPDVQLLGSNGGDLPTNVNPAHPGSGTAARVELRPGEAAASEARFSPDVPGGSEQGDNPCEPKAYRLRVLIGGGSLEVPVEPPTPVCERGSLFFSNFSAAR